MHEALMDTSAAVVPDKTNGGRFRSFKSSDRSPQGPGILRASYYESTARNVSKIW